MKVEVKAALKSYYSQTCSNCHLYKVTNTESAQANSDTIVTVQDIHLSNVTSNHFFCLPNKKNLSKTTIIKKCKNYVKSYNIIFLFSLEATEAFLEHSRTLMVGLFLRKKLTAKSC